jgi:hypothetical protein
MPHLRVGGSAYHAASKWTVAQTILATSRYQDVDVVCYVLAEQHHTSRSNTYSRSSCAWWILLGGGQETTLLYYALHTSSSSCTMRVYVVSATGRNRLP